MLAKKFDPSKVKYPCYLQRKLDGVRALHYPSAPTLQSRPKPPDFPLIFWNRDVLPHIHDELDRFTKLFPTLATDGELYNHSYSLQQINSRVAVKRTTPHADHLNVSYVIYDVFDTTLPSLSQEDRGLILNELLTVLTNERFWYVKVMPLVYCPDSTFFDQYHSDNLSNGYEGTMYRAFSDPYASHLNCGNKENRVWSLQKRKPSLDIECTVVGLNEGTGRLANSLGSFQLQDSSGAVFHAGSGLTDADRASFWSLGQQCIGAKVRVTFRQLSDSNLPLEPRIASVELD